jgi:hypothetical protein
MAEVSLSICNNTEMADRDAIWLIVTLLAVCRYDIRLRLRLCHTGRGCTDLGDMVLLLVE